MLELYVSKIDLIKNSLQELSSGHISLPKETNLGHNLNQLADLEAILDDLEVRAKYLRSKSKTKSDTVNKISRSSARSIKLPEIPLPHFSGRYEEWNYFKTQFKNIIVENVNSTDLEKLYYLRAAFKGEAKFIQTTDDTFESLF